jgi:hypothetical protein
MIYCDRISFIDNKIYDGILVINRERIKHLGIFITVFNSVKKDSPILTLKPCQNNNKVLFVELVRKYVRTVLLKFQILISSFGLYF